MTVKELIEKLKEMPEDAIVEIYKNDEYLDTVDNVCYFPPTDEIHNQKIVAIKNY